MSFSPPTKLDFQTLFEAVPGRYVVLLPDGPRYTIVAASDAYARATMTRRDDILGRGLFELFPDNPADSSELSASLGRVLSQRVPDVMSVQKHDMVRPTRDGGELEERRWRATNSPVLGPGGEVAYLIHAVEDVTEQQLLQEERQLFAALVENSSDFIGIADPSGKPVYLNPAGRRMVGLAPDHPVGEIQIPECYPPAERGFVSDVIMRETVEHGHWRGETYFRNWKTEEAIPVSDEHFMIREPGNGRILGMGTITRDITEARRAAVERERLLAQAKELFDQASDSIFIADSDGRFTDVNASACKMLGYTREELLAKTIVDIIPPADVPRLTATREYLLSPGTAEVAEWTQLKKDGTPFPVEVSSKILADGRWQAFVRDISERKRIERALQESEERFRLTFDEAPIGMGLVALDGRFVRVNRALCDIVGYSPAELKGLTFQAITHPDDLDADLVHAARFARGEIQRYQREKRYVRKDGTIVHVALNVSSLRGRDGAPLYNISQIEDITERKHAEDGLRRSESQYRGLIEHMPDGVFAYHGGRIVFANQAFASLLGYADGAALIDKPIGALLHPDDRRAVSQRIRALRKAGSSAPPKELRMIGSDGAIRNVETVGLEAQFGGQSSIVVIVRDLTERKRAEEALRISEAKFSGIVSISADAIISIDDDQRITIFNDGAEKIFGYSRAEAVGASLELLIPERLRKTHRQHVERFAAGEVTARRMGERLATVAGVRKNGEEFPAEASISKLQIGDKRLLTVSLRDISERKRVEQEQQFLAEAGAVLSASLDYEQTLVSLARLVVRDFADWCIVEIVKERDHLKRLKVVSADPTQAALCAQLEQVAIDRDRPYLLRSVVDTKQPLLIERVSSDYVESVAQGPEYLQALRAVAPVSVMGLPLLRHEELLGTLAFISSTPLRIYGQRDLRLAEALAERAAIAIENARLYRASVQATQLRDQVLGVVAHDLRNPLGAILMQASALERGGPGPERRSRKPSRSSIAPPRG